MWSSGKALLLSAFRHGTHSHLCDRLLRLVSGRVPAAHLVPHLRRIAVRAWAFALKNLYYRYAVRRHAWFGPFTISSILAHLVYVGGNVACLCYTGRAVSSTIASRAAILSLINIGPLFLAPHLSFLADLFGVLLTTYRQVHRSCGLVSASLLLTHALAAMRTRSVPLDTWSLSCAITGASALVLLVVLSIPSLRRRSYELFLRLHQLLAVVFAASAVYHVFSVSDLYRRPVYIFGGICGLSLLTQASLLLYRNYVHGKPWPRIQVEYDNDTLRATLRLPRPVRVDAGQYINLWVPSRAWLSSHPFTVTSWSPVAQDSMDLIIEPRRGFTNKLRQLSQYGQNQYLAFFSGPHGTTLPVLEYQTVILVATNFGLVWMRPYIKKLFNDYELGNRFRRRVRLVWHLDLQDRDGLVALVRPLIDDILENAAQNNYNLCVSIYCPYWETQALGDHDRLFVYKDAPDVKEIIQSEHFGHFRTTLQQLPGDELDDEKNSADSSDGTAADLPSRDARLAGDVQRQIRRANGRGLVLVSSTDAMRKALRETIRDYVGDGFTLRELEYQAK
ncbi:hypothetical protein B0T10DRAFT_552933 [Thelonectria olida]|uniref:ferric-chelate reductase (NADPH) n=1 Tax=Thelonectria olida TaxID=1576542 RepID=A0A9P8VR64_9HYPO|nr:hypothetical protein B0T10DRAFT_552933 [Thelonectria olida]